MKVQNRQHVKISDDKSRTDDYYNSTSSDAESTSRIHNAKTENRWRWINTGMGIFFLFASALQVNDPDYYLWIPVYTVPAMLAFAVVVRPSFIHNFMCRVISSVAFIFSIGFSIYLLVEFARVIRPEIGINPLLYEEGKEFLGVLIILVWLRAYRESSYYV